MEEQYWNNRYINEETGWDTGAAASALTTYFQQLKNKNISILIPGCGNAYEAMFLIENDFTNITLLDIAPELVNNLNLKFKNFVPVPLKIIQQDFFQHQQKYDLIIEQTFFCALPIVNRISYVQKMYELLKPGGKLVGLLFNREFEGGPPFGGSETEYRELFLQKFSIKTMTTAYNSIEPRKNSELFFIAQKEK